MSGVALVLVTTFLASAVEAIEMVAIVLGVGATHNWRSTFAGVGAAFGVLAIVVAALGAALSAIPIGALRLVVGAFLLVFGLQWFAKGVRRVAARGLAGMRMNGDGEPGASDRGAFDWTAFVLAFKGVLLEGIEVAFIVVSFGTNANHLGVAVAGGAAALVVVGGIGAALRRLVTRIPRSLLQLLVGILLTTFGSFWALEGLGVAWPGGDGALLGLLAFYVAAAAGYLVLERRRAFGFSPGV